MACLSAARFNNTSATYSLASALVVPAGKAKTSDSSKGFFTSTGGSSGSSSMTGSGLSGIVDCAILRGCLRADDSLLSTAVMPAATMPTASTVPTTTPKPPEFFGFAWGAETAVAFALGAIAVACTIVDALTASTG